MGSSQPPGPALVSAATDADPVIHLVLAWLSARRSENTRAAYARDIGITPQRRPGRAPSWLAWCQQEEVHPVTGVTGLHVARYARQLDHTGLSPASAARKLAAISSWYAWLARRGHITASPAAGIARPRPGPRTPAAPALTQDQALALIHAADTAPGPQRARTAALIAVLLFTSVRLSEVTGADVADLGTSGGRRVLWVTRAGGQAPGPATARPGRIPPRHLPRQPGRRGRRASAIHHPDRQAAVRRRRAPHPPPPRHPRRPAPRPGPPPGTAHAPPVLHHAVSSGRGIPRPPQQHAARRLTHHPAIRPGPEPRSATMAPRQAALPHPPPSTRHQAYPAALIPWKHPMRRAYQQPRLAEALHQPHSAQFGTQVDRLGRGKAAPVPVAAANSHAGPRPSRPCARGSHPTPGHPRGTTGRPTPGARQARHQPSPRRAARSCGT